MTEKFLAAWEKTRKSRYLPIGSKRVRRDGTPEGDYIEIKVRENGRWMLEHRWVMQQHIGRPLRTNEHVHHLDGNKKNNSIENLQLLSAVEHMSITAKEIVRNKQGLHQYTKCAHCGWRHPPHH